MTRLLSAALAVCLPTGLPAAAQEASQEAASGAFVETLVRLPKDGQRLALRDVDGDGALELLRADEAGLALFRIGSEGRYPSEPAALLPWPEGRVGWDLADLDGDGITEVVLALEAGAVRAHHVDVDGFGPAEALLEARPHLPAGVSRVRFARDVDGDGRLDLVLPGPGAHRIFLARDDGWSEAISIGYELDASYAVGDPERLSSTFGQRVRVPWFRIQDVDGDGAPDLLSETRERVAFHLAHPTLSSEPTWVLDLEALRDELPQGRNIDFENLFSVLDQRVSWKLADLDGEGALDLIVILGSKLRVYLNGAAAGPGEVPDQVLKASGNVLWTFVRPVAGEGDELPDLQIVRGERISVGRVLRSLILPSALEFDVFTYQNEGGTFSRRPTRRNQVVIQVPRLLSFIEDAEEIGDRIDAQFDIRARRLPRIPGAPAAGDDVADISGNNLIVFPGAAPEPDFIEDLAGEAFDPERFVETYFLEDLDARGHGATRTLDLAEVTNYDLAPGAILRKACRGVEPGPRHPLAEEGHEVDEILVRDLDGDGVTDVIVVVELGKQWVVQLLVRRGQG